MPILLRAFISLLSFRPPYVSKVVNKVAIGNEITIKPGSFRAKMFMATDAGSPISTIFLTRSKTTPNERENTVKEAIENSNGANNSTNNQLSWKIF